MFSIVVFLCAIVTVMLLAFLFYHTYLISVDRTTNEQVKAYQLESFCKKKLFFGPGHRLNKFSFVGIE